MLSDAVLVDRVLAGIDDASDERHPRSTAARNPARSSTTSAPGSVASPSLFRLP